MGATTPIFALPYPTGTDLIMDGDNAIQALAQRVEAVLNSLPKGQLGRASLTANSQPFGNSWLDIPELVVPVTLPANRRIRVSVMATTMFNAGVGPYTAHVAIREAGTLWQDSPVSHANPGYNYPHPVNRILEPAAGAHTYNVSCYVTAATAVLQATTTAPITLVVEDLGSTLAVASLPGPDVPDEPDEPTDPQPKGETP